MGTTTTKSVLLVTATDLAPEALDVLDDFEVVFTGKQPIEDDIVVLYARHKPMATIMRYGRINTRIMNAAAGNLQVISEHDSGIDVIDQDAAAVCGIAVHAAAGANATVVAEHAWASILACARFVPQLDARTRARHWDKTTHKPIELDGRTPGLVDLGVIGRRTAAAGLVLEVKVLAFDPYTKEAPAGVQLVALSELYAQSDVVSSHYPLTAENHKMLNRDAFNCFKPGAVLVNTARGGLIDEAVLVEALANGRLCTAGLDDFDVEPMTAPHPFQGITNIILSPHIGSVSDTAYSNMGKGVAANMLVVIKERARTTA